jgi:tRNA G18 (ribose-2'-O)-methylase SpoU
MEKTGGIIADNYKVKTFEEELTKAGFTVIGSDLHTPHTHLIKVKYKEEDQDKLAKLVGEIDAQCKAKRN